MAVIFSDTFDTSINATNWTDESGQWAVVGAEVRCGQAAQRHLKTTTTAHAAIADCRVTARRASASGFDAGIVVRSNVTGSTPSTGNCYILNIFGTQDIEVIRRVAGVNTTIATRTQAHADGDLFALEVTGTGATVTLKVFINGAQVGANIDDTNAARITAAGQTGFWNFAINSFMDDFSVDNLVGGTDTPLTVDSGAFVAAGQSINLIFSAAFSLPVAHGQAVFEAQAIPFILTQPGIDSAAVFAGQAVQLLVQDDLTLAVDAGSAVFAGQSVTLTALSGVVMSVTSSDAVFAGQNVALFTPFVLSAAGRKARLRRVIRTIRGR